MGVTAADVVMLGRVGETALSGASLAGQIQYIMTLFLFGLTSGATVLTAQYWGKKDTLAIEKIMGIALRLSICISVLFAIGACFFPRVLMMIFTSEEQLIVAGVEYLRIVGISYLFMGVSQIYLCVMRSVCLLYTSMAANQDASAVKEGKRLAEEKRLLLSVKDLKIHYPVKVRRCV